MEVSIHLGRLEEHLMGAVECQEMWSAASAEMALMLMNLNRQAFSSERLHDVQLANCLTNFG